MVSFTFGVKESFLMKYLLFFIIIIEGTQANAAGKLTITDSGILNIGSSFAYIAMCEIDGIIESGTLSDLMLDAQGGLEVDSWNRLKSQYQKSLHEKKQYSIAHDKWFPFTINKETCQRIAKAAPLLRSMFTRGKQ